MKMLRGVCFGRRLLIIVVVCYCLWFWGMVLMTEDYGVFDHLDVDADPVYSTSRRRAVPFGGDVINGTSSVGRFPVLPAVRRQKTSTVAPLVEGDLIPNGRDFADRLAVALSSFRSERLLTSVVDYGFVELALNFVATSIEPLSLDDAFFPICLDGQSAATLEGRGYRCLLLDLADDETLRPSDFGSEQYYRKTNIKTWVVLQLLKSGRSVLLSDVDVVLFHDPFPRLVQSASDLSLQMDREQYNSGFVYAQPTAGAVAVYENAWMSYLRHHAGHDQSYLNTAIRTLTTKGTVVIEELPSAEFPCGVFYFEYGRRHFYNEPPCPGCFMAHNNYMGSVAGKVYRFKENLLWRVDRHGYYSNPAVKYLIYGNRYDFGTATTLDRELIALINALVMGELTNRLVVLPSFRCCNCRTKSCDHPKNRCSLLSILALKTFDSVFAGKYREHSFLRNDLVPERIKRGRSPVVLMNTTGLAAGYRDISLYLDDDDAPSEADQVSFDLHQLSPKVSDVLTVLDRFSTYPVLRLHSLYGQFDFSDVRTKDGANLLELYRSGIKCANYEQWEASLEEKFFGKSS